jgi:hypothetical protein
MLWAARKIARLTGATDGGAYRTLESALIEAERPICSALRTGVLLRATPCHGAR